MPGAVVGLSDAVQISVGDRYTCAIRQGGTAVCWGDNTSFQGAGGADFDNHPAAGPQPDKRRPAARGLTYRACGRPSAANDPASAPGGAARSVELRQPPLEQAPLGVVVDQRERTAVGVAGLVGAAETAQQLAARRVQVAVVLEGEAVDDGEPRLGTSASATATARFSSTTGESVRRASSP